jgi:hypothetical protein
MALQDCPDCSAKLRDNERDSSKPMGELVANKFLYLGGMKYGDRL